MPRLGVILMSTARAHQKSGRDGHEGVRRHPFRNALILSLIIAALILWQLNPIIHGIHGLYTILLRAEGIRRVVAGLLTVGYHKAAAIVTPLVHRIGK